MKISRGGRHRLARLSRAASKVQRKGGGEEEGEGDEERDLEGENE